MTTTPPAAGEPLSAKLRAASRAMHTKSLMAMPAAPAPAPARFARYLACQRDAYLAMRDFPVHVPMLDDLEADLATIRSDALAGLRDCDDAYPTYLASSPAHVQGCHWYNLVFAHLAGGGRLVAQAAAPPGFLDTSRYYAAAQRVDVEGLRAEFDGTAATWTPAQRRRCVDETPTVFSFMVDMVP
jgi:hypothetical protein